MHKMTLVAAALLATVSAWSSAQAANETFTGTLSGKAEVPPTDSAGNGTAQVTLDTASKEITYKVTYSGLSGPAAAAHIHCGATGAAGGNAGVAVPFKDAASPISGSATLTDAQVADLEAGKCYVNVHTAANKGGELRAQLQK